MEVTIKNIAPMKVAFIRHIGPFMEVGPTWGKLMSWAGQRGLMGPSMTLLGLMHDDPDVTPPEKLRYDACIVLNRPMEPEGDVGIQDITGGEYAVAMHRGPYEKLGDTYAKFCGQWLPASGRELKAAPSFEVYHNSPQFTAPADLLTEIHLPLES